MLEPKERRSTASRLSASLARSLVLLGGVLRAPLVCSVVWGTQGCGADLQKDAGSRPEENANSAGTGDERPPADVQGVDAERHCDILCGRAKSCDEAFDRQTCVRACRSGSGVVANLNPDLALGLYECVDAASCATVGTLRFAADCLAYAASEQSPSRTGKAFCQQLASAADECNFTDFEERACWQATIAFSDEALASAETCAGKRCELLVPCLEATLQLPPELDGTPIGFDDGGISSGKTAVTATQYFLPETAGVSVAPGASTAAESTGPRAPAPVSSAWSSPSAASSNPGYAEQSTDGSEPLFTTDEQSTAPPSSTTGDPSLPDPSTTDASVGSASEASSRDPSPTDATSADSVTSAPEECEACLENACDEEATQCVNDAGCVAMVEYVSVCEGIVAEGVYTFEECVDAALSIVLDRYSESGVYAFSDWLTCLDEASPACGC